ncbi:MAG: UDP-N-acetylmuramate dehydrogenase [Candidatus Gracilibacteria bacterium]
MNTNGAGSAVSRELLEKFPNIEASKPLAPLNTMHIGGPADLYYKLTNIDELPELLQEAHKLQIPYFILGGGSNTVFADEGFRGLVIHLQAKNIALEPVATGEQPDSTFANPQSVPGHSQGSPKSSLPNPVSQILSPKSHLLTAESGASLSQVIQFALKNNLIGMEKLMGIPGTIGGAVRGNAGAFGVEIKDLFQKALIYSPKTVDIDAQNRLPQAIREVDSQYLDFSYRNSKIKKSSEIILKVYFKLHSADSETIKKAMDETADILKNRVSKQPKGYSTGSIFKNPGGSPSDPTGQDPKLKAGYLLEQVGAKGLQVGQIKVSDQHANWFLNLGGGTQKDLIQLCGILKAKVKERFNVDLEPEIQLVSAENAV